MTNKHSGDTFYWDPDKGERVRVTYRVYLTAPAWCEGVIEVEATSEEDAVRMALDEDHYCEIDWDHDYDTGEAEVVDVECEEPPEGAILFGAEPNTSVSLDALFGTEEDAAGELPSSSGKQPEKLIGGGGETCN